MKQLSSRRLRSATTLLLSLGVVGTGCAIALASQPMLRVTLTLVLLGVAAFLANFFRVARWALFDLQFAPTPKDEAEFKKMFPAAESNAS
jgi:hypothetical protein